MKSFCLLLLVGTFLFAGCSVEKEEKTESYSYDLNDGTCRAKRSFDSKEAYCAGLKDNKLNSDKFGRICSSSLRRKMFKRDCGGSFSLHAKSLEDPHHGKKSMNCTFDNYSLNLSYDDSGTLEETVYEGEIELIRPIGGNVPYNKVSVVVDERGHLVARAYAQENDRYDEILHLEFDGSLAFVDLSIPLSESSVLRPKWNGVDAKGFVFLKLLDTVGSCQL